MSATIAVIPARAGSKRLPGKNTRPFQGLPLIAYSIRAALRCSQIDRVIVSTNDEEVSPIAEAEGAEVFWRPPELATDHADTFDVLKHVAAQCSSDSFAPRWIVLLQPTSPLRRQSLIADGLNLLAEDAKATSLISVFPQQRFTGAIDSGGYYRPHFPENTRSQDIPPVYIPTGNLYIYRAGETLEKNDALGTHPKALIEEAGTFVNIDDLADWQAMETVYQQYQQRFAYLLEESSRAAG